MSNPTTIEALTLWYRDQNAAIEDGTYRCIPVPGEAEGDVINHDENGNLGYWLTERLYGLMDDDAAVEAAWQSITGIVD